MIKLKRMEWLEYVACIVQIRNACKMLVSNSEWKRFLERTRRRWEYSIKIVLTEIRQEGVDQFPWVAEQLSISQKGLFCCIFRYSFRLNMSKQVVHTEFLSEIFTERN
jgi:hypothetical protein